MQRMRLTRSDRRLCEQPDTPQRLELRRSGVRRASGTVRSGHEFMQKCSSEWR